MSLMFLFRLYATIGMPVLGMLRLSQQSCKTSCPKVVACPRLTHKGEGRTCILP